MSAENATLIAAAIAAAAGILTLILTNAGTRSAEARAAHRAALAPHLSEIGLAIHEAIAAGHNDPPAAQSGSAAGSMGPAW